MYQIENVQDAIKAFNEGNANVEHIHQNGLYCGLFGASYSEIINNVEDYTLSNNHNIAFNISGIYQMVILPRGILEENFNNNTLPTLSCLKNINDNFDYIGSSNQFDNILLDESYDSITSLTSLTSLDGDIVV